MNSRRKALLAVSGVVLLLVSLFVIFGYEQTWLLWNVPSLSPPFADLRSITHGADAVALGLDPLISNPGDPWGRPLNYPRIWQSLYSVGLNKSHTVGLGLCVIFSFLVGVVLVLPNANNKTIFLVIGALVSPAVLLGVERANVDLFVFFLAALSIVLVRKSIFLADGVIIFATALKLIPVFFISLLLRSEKKLFFGHFFLVVAVVITYFFAKLSELRLISRATPRAIELSYGADVAWKRIQDIDYSMGLLMHSISVALVVLAVCLFFIGCSRAYAIKSTGETDGSFGFDSFRVGASVYIGTFLIGNNWDYRLSFLIFCIPQLVSWLTSPSKDLRWCSRSALFAMFISLWYLFILRVFGAHFYLWVFDELANWTLFLLLVYLFAIALPLWGKDMLMHPFRLIKRVV